MSLKTRRPRIIFFTGLGCDERMVAPHRAIHADIDFVPWVEPLPNESLVAYSRRMAEKIDVSTPFYLAGISLGGMVALEIARIHRPLGLILLSTCRSRAGVPWQQRLIAQAVSASPLWLVHLGKTVVPHMRQLFGIFDAKDVELFAAMMAAASDSSIAWSLKAVAEWPGADPVDVPTLQVHGERDRILPLRRAGKVNAVIEAAGHAVTVTHNAEVNAVIDAWLAHVARGDKTAGVDFAYRSTSHRGMPETLPAVGSVAPDFTLPDENNKPVKLSDYRGKSAVVIYFYPKADTPGCTKEACGFRDGLAGYQSLSVPVFGISPDPVADVKSFHDKFHLNFPLLADADHKVCEQYGVWAQRPIYGWGANRVTFVVDKDGKVAKVFEKVNAEGHDGEVLAWLTANPARIQ